MLLSQLLESNGHSEQSRYRDNRNGSQWPHLEDSLPTFCLKSWAHLTAKLMRGRRGDTVFSPSYLPCQGTDEEVAAGPEGDGRRWRRALAPFPPPWTLPQVPPHGARPPQGSEGDRKWRRRSRRWAPSGAHAAWGDPRRAWRCWARCEMAGIGHFPAAFPAGTTLGGVKSPVAALSAVPFRCHGAQPAAGLRWCAEPPLLSLWGGWRPSLHLYTSRCARRLGHCFAGRLIRFYTCAETAFRGKGRGCAGAAGALLILTKVAPLGCFRSPPSW